jgi:CTP:molybdopterin cytidylyltransferase MocA
MLVSAMSGPRPPGSAAAVLLAAGPSSRMGEQKLVLDLGGEPLARHALIALVAAGNLDPIVVVLGFEAERVRDALEGLGATFVVNREYESGIESSLRTGARALADNVAALFALADQALVPAEHYAALAARALESGASLVATEVLADLAMKPHAAQGPALEDVREQGLDFFELAALYDSECVACELDVLHDVDTPNDLAYRRYQWG